jgi:hypothetical protein
MSASEIMLHGFAYGEELDAFGQRSLGYHLLAPAGGTTWGHGVETLARRLQAAPYPDTWPPVDLFCSILLSERQRLIAVARYGVTDHSRDQRRGGLELTGVVTKDWLEIPTILSIDRWLRTRRASTDDLRSLGGEFRLAEVLVREAPSSQMARGLPDLPARLWQDGAILFGATFPGDPDHHLDLLDLSRNASWQWLPLVGTDFPLQHYARLGPLVAWTVLLPEASSERRETATIALATESGNGARTPLVVAAFVLEERVQRP